MMFKAILVTASFLILGGCATWSTSSVEGAAADKAVSPTAVTPESIYITDSDVFDKKYSVLGDITVNVNKTTIFHREPTREQVNSKLKEKAAELGADAVILVRYGQGGVSFVSWGSLEGKGRAIKFQQ